MEVSFDNGTVVSKRPPPRKDASPYEKAIAEELTIDFNNGTKEVKFFNGTQIRINEQPDGTEQVDFIRPPESYAEVQKGDDSVIMNFNNGT
jgi:hypothetical protein